jgi:hypothetical protein
MQAVQAQHHVKLILDTAGIILILVVYLVPAGILTKINNGCTATSFLLSAYTRKPRIARMVWPKRKPCFPAVYQTIEGWFYSKQSTREP